VGIFDPNLEKLIILLAVLVVCVPGLWLFIRSAVRSGVRSGGEERRDRMDEVRRWEESQRNMPR
jgi:hypothetical protein